MSRYFQHKLPGKLIIYLNKHISEPQVTEFLSKVTVSRLVVSLLGKQLLTALPQTHHCGKFKG